MSVSGRQWEPERSWHASGGLAATVARNVGTRYLAIVVEAGIGFLLLPFNVAHLGPSAYGLWMLAASVTAYFSILDFGYAQSLVRFVARYRAREDAGAINETINTLFVLFTFVGALVVVVAAIVAWQLGALFNLEPGQLATGRRVLLIVAGYVAIGFAFSVFGAVVNGFQRYDLNNGVAVATSIAAALVNVGLLAAGYGLVEVVAGTTLVRALAYAAYRSNAYRVFPHLRIDPRLFSRSRLREVTGFSVYILVLDWSAKLNYSFDAIVIGSVLGTAAVATWTVAERLAALAQRLTNQLNEVLFPAIVESDAASHQERLRRILVHGTRISVAAVAPVAAGLFFLVDPLVSAWVGPQFASSVTVARILALVVFVRVADATAATVLKGGGLHRRLAAINFSTAVANLGISLALVGRYGLPGVAVGTLIPVTATAVFAIFPSACRLVGLPVTAVLRQGVWPALWPGAATALLLGLGRDMVPPSMAAVALAGSAAGVFYLSLFWIAIGRDERRAHVGTLRAWIERRRIAATS